MKNINTKIQTRSFLQITMLLLFFVLSQNLNAQITAPVANVEYYIKNVSSGQYLTVNGTNYAVDAASSGTNTQKFTFELVSGSLYKIKNVGNSFYMYRSSNGYDVKFQASYTNSWYLEAYNGKTLIKTASNGTQLGINSTNSGAYYDKGWSTSTTLQWDIIDANVLVKTALQTALNTANSTKSAAVVGSGNGQYFQSNYDTFSTAISTAQGVYDSPTSQAQIDAAVTTLNTAVSTFTASAIQNTTLQTAISTATTTKNAATVGTTQGTYLQADYDTFVAAIATAQGVYNNPTSQAQINTAVTTLNTAKTTFSATMILFVPEAGKYYSIKYGTSELALNGRVSTWAEINTLNTESLLQRIRFEAVPSQAGKYFILNGNDVYLKQPTGNLYDLTWGTATGAELTTNVTQYTLETVNTTDVRIKSVKSSYLGVDASTAGTGVWADKPSTHVWRIVSAPDLLIKTTLESAITDATALKNAAVVGSTQGRYPQANYDTFVAAIATAQSVYDNPTSQIQINAAVTTLNTAKSTFAATMIKFVPVAGRYYTIKYKEIDIAISKSNSTAGIQIRTTNASDVLQRIRFVADNLYPGSYWIYNGNNQALSQVYGNDYGMDWETPASGSTWNGYRYYIETINETDIRIKSEKSELYLGVDATTDGTTVYSDKNNTYYWKNIATDYYSSASNSNISDLVLNPSSELTVEKGFELTINAVTTVNSITLMPGAKLTLGSGQTLTTTNGVTLQSDATGTATFVDTNNSSPITVSGTAQQYLTAERNWYTACPVTAGTAAGLNTGTSVQTYTESTKGWSIIDGTTSLVAGKGYVSVAQAGTGTTGNVSFNGTFNTGTITVPVTRTAGAKEGFNLVANPYPSYLDWSLVTADAVNTAIGKTMWFRTKTAANAYTFSTYNSTGDESVANGASTTITKHIPPMQAFWIKVNIGTASTDLSFKNSMRAHKDVSGNSMKAPKVDERVRLRLQLENGTVSDETLIYFDANASNVFDNYDSPKMFNNSTTMPDLYTKSGSERLVINGLNEMTDNMELPLGFSLDAAATLKLKVIQMTNFASDKHVYLLDNEDKTQIELIPEAEYSFSTTSATMNNESRFSLIFRTSGTATGVNTSNKLNAQVFVNAANQITIIAKENSSYAIYNAMGQLLNNGKLQTESETLNNKLSAGVYVVKVNNQSTRIVVK